ncbi:hypothetical protein ACJX0J_027262, partial [Zea mays]
IDEVVDLYDLANLGLELSNFYCQISQISGTEIQLIWGNCTSELFVELTIVLYFQINDNNLMPYYFPLHH